MRCYIVIALLFIMVMLESKLYFDKSRDYYIMKQYNDYKKELIYLYQDYESVCDSIMLSNGINDSSYIKIKNKIENKYGTEK